MSYDLKIQNPCDHYINWEKGTLSPDRKSVILKYPVAAVSSVSLKVDLVDMDRDMYEVLRLKTEQSLQPFYYIYLKNKVKTFLPFIETTYTTLPYSCPKCFGVKYLDDLRYNLQGDMTVVSNEYLLIQHVEKYIVTKLNSNVFHDWMGTQLHSLVGTKILDINFLKTQIVEQINSSIEKLKTVQAKTLALGRPITPGELFDKLLSVEVSQSTEDSTVIMVLVRFTAKSGKSLEYNQFMELSQLRKR